MVGSLIEALFVNILNSFENKGLDHSSEVGLVDREGTGAELFLLLEDRVDEVFDHVGIDSDSFGRMERPRAEEVESETLRKRGPRAVASWDGEFVTAGILDRFCRRWIRGDSYRIVGFSSDGHGVLLDFVSHSSFP